MDPDGIIEAHLEAIDKIVAEFVQSDPYRTYMALIKKLLKEGEEYGEDFEARSVALIHHYLMIKTWSDLYNQPQSKEKDAN